MSEADVKKVLKTMVMEGAESVPGSNKALLLKFACSRANASHGSLFDVVTALVEKGYPPELSGKRLASLISYMKQKKLNFHWIEYQPIGGEDLRTVSWKTFQETPDSDIDWTYLPQASLNDEYEIELWQRWLLLKNLYWLADDVIAAYHSAFRIAGATILAGVRSGIKKLSPSTESVLPPVRCLTFFANFFSALLQAVSLKDTERVEAEFVILKQMLPDLEVEDVVFGRDFDLFDSEAQQSFNAQYIRVLLCRFFLPSNPEFSLPEAAVANNLYFFQKEGNLCEFLSLLSLKHVPIQRGSRNWIPLVSEILKAPFGVRMFVNLLRSYAADYAQCVEAQVIGRSYQAPIIALCNSSGVGKTRLALSTATSCQSILICLREPKFNGYPRRSAIADYVLDPSVFTSSLRATYFLQACLSAWIFMFNQWIPHKIEITRIYQRFYATEENNFLKIMGDLISLNEPSLKLADYPSSFHDQFWSTVRQIHSEAIKDTPLVSPTASPTEEKSSKPQSSTARQEDAIAMSLQQTLRSASQDAEEVGDVYLEFNNFDDLHYRMQIDEEAAEQPDALTTEIDRFKKLEDEARDALVKAGIMKPEDDPFFVITFDEARYLLSAAKDYKKSFLRHLRHGSRPFVGGFIVLTDTLSQLSYISPPPRYDYSAKDVSYTHSFPPNISIPLLNVISCNVGAYRPALEPAAPGYSSLSYNPLTPVDMSRPMYPAYFNTITRQNTSEDVQKHVRHVHRLAFVKFLGPIQALQFVRPSHPLLAAVLAARLSGRYVSYMTNSTLMAFHMGLAVYLSEDGEVLTVSYQGEPMATLAAGNVMYHSDELFALSITALRCNLERGLMVSPNAGNVGELLVALYLLMARDWPVYGSIKSDSSKIHDFGRPRKVQEMLQYLISAQQMTFLENCGIDQYGRLMNSFATFSSFFPLNKQAGKQLVTRRILVWALESRVALYLPPNTNGIDLIIPIVVGQAGTDPMTISPESVGAIVIQAKNRSDKLFPSRLSPILESIRSCTACFEPGIPILLGILMNVGPSGLEAGKPSSSVKFSDENNMVSSSFPVVSVSSGMVQTLLNLSPSIRHDLDAMTNFTFGPLDGIRRLYAPSHSSDEDILALAQHIHPEMSARGPSTVGQVATEIGEISVED